MGISVKGILEDVHNRNISTDQAEEILQDMFTRGETMAREQGYAQGVAETIKRLNGEQKPEKTCATCKYGKDREFCSAAVPCVGVELWQDSRQTS